MKALSRLLFALCLVAAPVAAQAQTVTVTTPNTVNGAGQPTTVGKTFLINPDGTVATIASSGGGAVTVANGADVTQGAIADTAYAGSGSASVVSVLKGLYTGMVAATPSGTNIIGKVGIDQTTPGTTNAVVATGPVATGVAASGNPLPGGCKANSSLLAAVSVNQRQDVLCGTGGQTVVSVGSNSGIASISAGGSAVNMSFSPGGGTNPFGVLPYLWNSTTGLAPIPGDANGTITQPFAVAGSRWSYAAATGGISNTTTGVTVASAAGAGVRNYVASMQCMTDGVMGAGSEFVVNDGAAGTVLFRLYVGTAGLPNGGTNYEFSTPLKGTTNTLIEIKTLTAQVSGKLFCNLQGFTGV